MKSLHDPEAQKEILARLDRLTADSERRWGKMTAPQMVNHLNMAFNATLGKLGMTFQGNPFYARISKFFTFTPLPIPHNWVKIPVDYESLGAYDIDQEKLRFRSLLREFSNKQTDWPEHLFLGHLTREEYGKLQYKHVDHHLKQFGV